jgi:hypothetical protein
MNYYGVVISGCSRNYYVTMLVNFWCLAGMGDPPGLIYPSGYGSREIPHPWSYIGIPVVSYCYHGDGSGEYSMGIYPLPSGRQAEPTAHRPRRGPGTGKWEKNTTPPSQNNCTCWLLRFTFDHSSYLKKIVKILFILLLHILSSYIF